VKVPGCYERFVDRGLKVRGSAELATIDRNASMPPVISPAVRA
jgi:hypothetical protein